MLVKLFDDFSRLEDLAQQLLCFGELFDYVCGGGITASMNVTLAG